MLTYVFKLMATEGDIQYSRLDEAIRAGRFIQNSCLRYWMDNRKSKRFSMINLSKYANEQLAEDFLWVKKLTAQTRWYSAKRAWAAIKKYSKNEHPKKVPFFKPEQIHGSLDYAKYGYRFLEKRTKIKFTDGFGAGVFELVGSQDISQYGFKDFKILHIVRNAAGYFLHCCVDDCRKEKIQASKERIGLSFGADYFLVTSEGDKIEHLTFHKSQTKIKKSFERFQRTKKSSANRAKMRKILAKRQLKLYRQRKDALVKIARNIVKKFKEVVYEDCHFTLNKDFLGSKFYSAGWGLFLKWITHYGEVFDRKITIITPTPIQRTCSCGNIIKCTGSINQCPNCNEIQVVNISDDLVNLSSTAGSVGIQCFLYKKKL